MFSLSSLALSSLKRQYFFAYAVLGSVMPFWAVFLKQKGFEETQIGLAMAVSQIAVLLTPVVLTLLADTRFDSRHLMAGALTISSAAIGGLYFSVSLGPILLLMCLQSLSYVAVFPLLDALSLGQREKQEANGEGTTPYHHLRVWGTVGFIVPGVALFGLFWRGGGISWILACAILFSMLGALNAFILPAPQRTSQNEKAASNAPKSTSYGAHDRSRPWWARFRKLPTFKAARALSRPQVRIFCACLMLTNVAGAAYFAFFPLYLTEVVGITPQWIGPINNVGVVFEIFFMLGFSWFLKHWGFKTLMLAGIACMAARMALLAAFPIPAVAVATQVIHGLVVLAITVAPVMYLNLQAGESYRNSMQGLYNMVVAGSPRMVGSLLGGYIAQGSLLLVMALAALLTLVAGSVLLFAFHDEAVPQAGEV
jgi:PPP family 3-phenylpropionic acid transporter